MQTVCSMQEPFRDTPLCQRTCWTHTQYLRIQRTCDRWFICLCLCLYLYMCLYLHMCLCLWLGTLFHRATWMCRFWGCGQCLCWGYHLTHPSCIPWRLEGRECEGCMWTTKPAALSAHTQIVTHVNLLTLRETLTDCWDSMPRPPNCAAFCLVSFLKPLFQIILGNV